MAAMILIALTVVTDVVVTSLDWVYAAQADVPALDLVYALAGWISLVAYVVAGITFMVWMSQARLNSDAITSAHQHRYTKMWVFVGWLIPFANLVLPHIVMQDIWRGSDRTQPMVGLQQRAKSGLINAWWACFLVYVVASGLSARTYGENAALLSTLSTVAAIAAALVVVRIIRQINDMQINDRQVIA